METAAAPPPPTTAAPAPAVSYAGFWKRFAAWIIDHLILGAIACMLFIPFAGMMGLSALECNWDRGDQPSVEFLLACLSAFLGALVLSFLLTWLYFALLESWKGATFGKMALGIAVTDMSGRRVSFGRASGRYFGRLVSNMTFGIGYIIAGFTQQKQALHDILSGCLVVNK